jgi:hypothetical protein
MSRVTVVLVCGREEVMQLAASFLESPLVDRVLAFSASGAAAAQDARLEVLATDQPAGGKALRQVFKQVRTDYVLFVEPDTKVRLGRFALERLCDVADQTGAGMVYADHWVCRDEVTSERPVIDCQLGSIRDDL